MQKTQKLPVISLIALLLLWTVLLAIPATRAETRTITLTPNSQTSGASITVTGTGFGATKAVGIGFGAEVAVTSEVLDQTGSGFGPYTSTLTGRPIEPGTARFTHNVGGGLATFVVMDNGDGTVASTSGFFANGTINYATGQYTRYSTTDPGTLTVVVTANYTCYQYNVTPAAGIITSSSGAFSASVTVPSVPSGTYNVTVIDASGNRATSSLTVGASVGASLVLTPTAQAPGASVTVSGSGFGATAVVGIGFGAEVQVINETMQTTGPFGVSGGPYHGNTTYLPVKPCTFKMALALPSGTVYSLFSDVAGNGTLDVASTFSAQVVNATVDYVTGQFTAFWKAAVAPENQAIPHIINYTHCQYIVTPTANITTGASGSFSVNIVVPSVANGNYNVTAIDASGKQAVATLTVNSAIPEVLPVEVIMLLSTTAVVIGTLHLRKRPRIAN